MGHLVVSWAKLSQQLIIYSSRVCPLSLSPHFYDSVCPQALPAIKKIVEATVHKERCMRASLLRLCFHDCFVNGSDGSLLLDSTSSFESEKNAPGNLNYVRGFEVVDRIKAEVDRVLEATLGMHALTLHTSKTWFSIGGYSLLMKLFSMVAQLINLLDDYAKSMIKMGNIKPLTEKQGKIRVNCRKVN
ncbi:hypothetical protein REPUB_Repub15cG0142700 [Reevesia pubescens]